MAWLVGTPSVGGWPSFSSSAAGSSSIRTELSGVVQFELLGRRQGRAPGVDRIEIFKALEQPRPIRFIKIGDRLEGGVKPRPFAKSFVVFPAGRLFSRFEHRGRAADIGRAITSLPVVPRVTFCEAFHGFGTDPEISACEMGWCCTNPSAGGSAVSVTGRLRLRRTPKSASSLLPGLRRVDGELDDIALIFGGKADMYHGLGPPRSGDPSRVVVFEPSSTWRDVTLSKCGAGDAAAPRSVGKALPWRAIARAAQSAMFLVFEGAAGPGICAGGLGRRLPHVQDMLQFDALPSGRKLDDQIGVIIAPRIRAEPRNFMRFPQCNDPFQLQLQGELIPALCCAGHGAVPPDAFDALMGRRSEDGYCIALRTNVERIDAKFMRRCKGRSRRRDYFVGRGREKLRRIRNGSMLRGFLIGIDLRSPPWRD